VFAATDAAESLAPMGPFRRALLLLLFLLLPLPLLPPLLLLCGFIAGIRDEEDAEDDEELPETGPPPGGVWFRDRGGVERGSAGGNIPVDSLWWFSLEETRDG
jgi:hypothetical protein